MSGNLVKKTGRKERNDSGMYHFSSNSSDISKNNSRNIVFNDKRRNKKKG